jgi:hypothetical protein
MCWDGAKHEGRRLTGALYHLDKGLPREAFRSSAIALTGLAMPAPLRLSSKTGAA